MRLIQIRKVATRLGDSISFCPPCQDALPYNWVKSAELCSARRLARSARRE